MKKPKAIKPDGIEDRPLTDLEKQQIASGQELKIAWGQTPSFADLPVETLNEYRIQALASRKRKYAARKIADMNAWIAAHQEHAHDLLGAKIAIIESMLDEMKVVDKESGEVFYDTKLMDEKRLKVLTTEIKDFEKRAFESSKKQSDVTINIAHIVADLSKSLKS